MTAEERADLLGDVIRRQELPPKDEWVEVWRSDIAAAIRAAVAEEREACARMADEWNHGAAAAIRARKL